MNTKYIFRLFALALLMFVVPYCVVVAQNDESLYIDEEDCGCDAGVVISASHNPMEFNGIKFFNGEGYKLSDELEDEIGDAIDDDDMYAQTSLVKKQKILQEGPKEKSFTKIIYNELSKYLKENNVEVDISIYDDNMLTAIIEDGDWKHDHLHFRNLINDFFWDINEDAKMTSKVTSSDGSDTYSAEYRIYLQNKKFMV